MAIRSSTRIVVLGSIVGGLFIAAAALVARGGDLDDASAKAAGELRGANKELSEDTLKADRKVLRESYDECSAYLKDKGITNDKDVQATIIINWQLLRLKPDGLKANETLSREKWSEVYRGLEPCFIKSKPEQNASIEINGVKHSSTTDAHVGLRPDMSYTIKLRKGTRTAQGELKVEKGRANTFEGTLE
jgi:hypothetical protein